MQPVNRGTKQRQRPTPVRVRTPPQRPCPRRMIGGAAGIGPAWTRGEMEPPAGEKSMGSSIAAVYTPEQQARLNVTEYGEPVASLPAAAAAGPVKRRVRSPGAAARSQAKLDAIRARQAAGCAKMQAAQAAAPPYPAHWGQPPLTQTRDLRPLPGAYGMGSGTFATWIQGKMEADAAAAAGNGGDDAGCGNGGGFVPVGGSEVGHGGTAGLKTSWPELIGASGDDAVRAILQQRPDLRIGEVSVFDEGSCLTEDWREDRVRVIVNASTRVVSQAPAVG